MEQVVESSHHDAGLDAVADHGVRLAGAGGTVREHRGVVTLEHVLHQLARRRRVHLLLRRHDTHMQGMTVSCEGGGYSGGDKGVQKEKDINTRENGEEKYRRLLMRIRKCNDVTLTNSEK